MHVNVKFQGVFARWVGDS